ncbi:MAG TPA: SMC-Scp complex subunit ScpB [Candidatus Nanoarchaeia archaeon]|nr:SMC-Scp complex subunit ScpB [Candidatus Nanoarchaeia archaeon]
MTLESKIEALLFWKGEPLKIKEIAKILVMEPEDVEPVLEKLEKSLSGRGISLSRNGDEVMLYTAPEASELIKELTKEELSRDVSKAAVEVLALVIYHGPIAKRDIDYIRGVNSSYIIRNLMVRGLIERSDSGNDRSFTYQPTFELLAHLGVSKKEDLEDFAAVTKELKSFVESKSQETNG